MDPKQEQKDQKEEVDERGVPLINKVKELERKFQEKEQALNDTRRELNELKTSWQAAGAEAQQETKPDMPKEELMELVKGPKAFFKSVIQEEEQRRQQQLWQNQAAEAEAWLKTQNGYSDDAEARITQMVTDWNKSPKSRAETAWKALQAEKFEKERQAQTDENKRQTSVSQTAMEGTGKSTPKEQPVTRVDILRKLKAAEEKGDIDTSIKYIEMLEDIR